MKFLTAFLFIIVPGLCFADTGGWKLDRNLSCGLTGSVKERLADCAKSNDSKIPGFNLVEHVTHYIEDNYGVRMEHTRYVRLFMDKKTGRLWIKPPVSTEEHYYPALKACEKLTAWNVGLQETNLGVQWKLPSSQEMGTAIANGLFSREMQLQSINADSVFRPVPWYWTSDSKQKRDYATPQYPNVCNLDAVVAVPTKISDYMFLNFVIKTFHLKDCEDELQYMCVSRDSFL